MKKVQIHTASLLMLMLYAFLGDVALLGSGAWSINIFGFSIRKIEYILILLITILTIDSIKKFNLLLLMFVFCAIYGIFVPQYNGVPLSYSLTELLPFFGVMLCPIISNNLIVQNNWSKLSKYLFYVCLLSAILHIVVWLIGLLDPVGVESIKELLTTLLTTNDANSIDNIIIAQTPDGLFRVLLPSSSLMIIGFYLALKKYLYNKNVKNCALVVFMFIALYSTWTRALYLSPVIVILGLIISCLFDFRFKIKGYTTYVLFSSAALLFVLSGVLIVQPELLKILGIASETSDSIRYDQVTWILKTFYESPFMGTGLGGSAADIRSVLAPWTYEMSLLALMMKIGIIGCVSYFMINFMIMPEYFRGFFNGNKLEKRKRVWLFFSISVLVMFSTNPFMLSFPGITIIFFMLGELCSFKNRAENFDKY